MWYIGALLKYGGTLVILIIAGWLAVTLVHSLPIMATVVVGLFAVAAYLIVSAVLAVAKRSRGGRP